MPSRRCTDPFAVLFGARIRLLRMEKQMSLVQLSVASGVAKGHLSEIESGRVVVTLGTAARLAHALKAPVFVLFLFPDDDPWVVVIEHLRLVSAGDWTRAAALLRELIFQVNGDEQNDDNDDDEGSSGA